MRKYYSWSLAIPKTASSSEGCSTLTAACTHQTLNAAIIANFDAMDCKMVECTTSEALYLASTKALFVSPKTFTSPTPLLDEESSPLPLPPPHEITKSQYEAMSPTTKATYLLYDKDFNPRNIPRCRYVETKQGLDYVKSRLLPLLDSTVQKSLSTTKKEPGLFISKKQFAADRRDEASRKGEPALARVWNEEVRALPFFL